MSVGELHEIEGYRICRCGTLVAIAQAEMQQGQCYDCFAVAAEPLKLVEVIHQGRRAMLPARPAKGRTGSKGSKRKARAVEKAKLAALKRLRSLYPEMYDMLYDEERVRRGLGPLARPGHRTHVDTLGTYDMSAVYAALTEPGAPDGHPSP